MQPPASGLRQGSADRVGRSAPDSSRPAAELRASRSTERASAAHQRRNIACASCHAEGGDDGHVWGFDGIGPRRTPSLLGTVAGTEPFHWDGDQKDLRDLVDHVFVERMGGPAIDDERLGARSGCFSGALRVLPRGRDAHEQRDRRRRDRRRIPGAVARRGRLAAAAHARRLREDLDRSLRSGVWWGVPRRHPHPRAGTHPGPRGLPRDALAGAGLRALRARWPMEADARARHVAVEDGLRLLVDRVGRSDARGPGA